MEGHGFCWATAAVGRYRPSFFHVRVWTRSYPVFDLDESKESHSLPCIWARDTALRRVEKVGDLSLLRVRKAETSYRCERLTTSEAVLPFYVARL